MNLKNFGILFFVAALSLNSFAAVMPKTLTCDQNELSVEPMTIIQRFGSAAWGVHFDQAQTLTLFNPVTVNKAFVKSNLVRQEVTSSHIVNIVADGLQHIQDTISELIKGKKIEFLEEGANYPEDEYRKKFAAQEEIRRQSIEPILANLYKVYIEAIKNRKDQAALGASAQDRDAFLKILEDQKKSIAHIISKTEPGLLEKLGEISPGSDSSIPFSYRDGHIVKIRFKKPGAKYHITVYPTMILNRLANKDDYFIKALYRWKEYCEQNYQAAKLIVEAKGVTWAMNYASGYFSYKLGNSKLSPEELQDLYPYIQQAYQAAERDLEQAKWVQEQLAQLTETELLSILELFRVLRFGDYPRCQSQLVQMNKRMATDFLKGKRSSAELSPEAKLAADRYAKDVAFYQDQYKVFSTVAAILVSLKAK